MDTPDSNQPSFSLALAETHIGCTQVPDVGSMLARAAYGGLLQSLSEWDTPAPQLRLHSDQEPHSPQWLSIARGFSPIAMHRPP